MDPKNVWFLFPKMCQVGNLGPAGLPRLEVAVPGPHITLNVLDVLDVLGVEFPWLDPNSWVSDQTLPSKVQLWRMEAQNSLTL